MVQNHEGWMRDIGSVVVDGDGAARPRAALAAAAVRSTPIPCSPPRHVVRARQFRTAGRLDARYWLSGRV